MLGLGHTITIVIGAIIGVGIFFTPAQVARLAGSEDRALVLWVLGGVSAACGGLVFGELGRRFPVAGGQYQIIRTTWGAFPGFVYIVCLLTAIQAGAAAIIAQIAARNLVVAAGSSATDGQLTALALALIGAVVIANTLGVRAGVGVQMVSVGGKLLALAVVVGLAVRFGGATAVAPAPVEDSGWTWGVLAGLLPAMFSYGGWQHGLWMAGEVRDPERNVPRGIGIGVAVVIVTYVAAAWAWFALLGYDGVVGAKALAAEAVATVWPGFGARLIAGAVGLSAFGVLNAQFLAGPRQVWALASDGLFLPVLARLHPTRRTPALAILTLGGCAAAVLLLVGADGIGPLTAWTVVIDTLFFALTALALLRMHWTERRFRASSAAALAFLTIELGAMGGALTQESVRAAAWTGIAWVGVVVLAYPVLARSGRT